MFGYFWKSGKWKQRKTQRVLHSHQQKRHSCFQFEKSSSFMHHLIFYYIMHSNSNRWLATAIILMSQNATQQAVLVTQIDPRRFWSKQLLKVCLLQQKENVRSSRLCQQAFLTRITPCLSKCTWTNIQSKYWTYAFNIRKDLFTSPPRKAREDEAAGNSGSFTQPPLPYLLLLLLLLHSCTNTSSTEQLPDSCTAGFYLSQADSTSYSPATY